MKQCFDGQLSIVKGGMDAKYSLRCSPSASISFEVVKALEEVDRWVSAELKILTQLKFFCAVDFRKLNSCSMHYLSCLESEHG